jgi:cutinase
MNPDSAKIGAADVISRIQKQHKECPTQKFAVVGYSQGSMVMRAALGDAKAVGEDAYRQIVAGAMFGGPKGGERFGGSAGKGGIPALPKGAAPPAGGAPSPAALPADGVSSAPKTPGVPSGKGIFGGVSPKFDMGLEEKVRWNCAKDDPVR